MSKSSDAMASEIALRAKRLSHGRNAVKAGRALGEMGATALGALVEALGNENPFIRSGALHGLAAIVPADEGAMKAVAGALAGDPDPRVRETACMMLAQIGDAAIATARSALDQAASDADERVRVAAAKAVGTFTPPAV